MKYTDLTYKTITVNHEEKYVNVYIHTVPSLDTGDGLLTLASNLLSIGLNVDDPKHQVFDGDIAELFDWGANSSEDPIAIVEICWDTQLLGWSYFVNSEDYRQFGDPEINDYDRWRTSPRTINNKHIPEGYEIRTHYSL
jgi:hypothetical protein